MTFGADIEARVLLGEAIPCPACQGRLRTWSSFETRHPKPSYVSCFVDDCEMHKARSDRFFREHYRPFFNHTTRRLR